MWSFNLFKCKQWLWNKWQALLGTDRAYTRYLKHFEHYQTQVVDGSLQQSLNIQPMSKEAFLAAWHKKPLKPAGKSCGCQSGNCH